MSKVKVNIGRLQANGTCNFLLFSFKQTYTVNLSHCFWFSELGGDRRGLFCLKFRPVTR